MKLEYVPLLGLQRELYQQPVGQERFRSYLALMLEEGRGDIKLPLSAMNPMAKPHVASRLDELLALGAEAVGAKVTVEVERELAGVAGKFRVALVVADDVAGGWTERYFTEFKRRFESQAYHKRGWIEGGLWASENPTSSSVAECVKCAIYRAAYIQQRGAAHTLSEMLAQEGYAMRAVDNASGVLSADELAATEAIIAPHLEATDKPTLMACLFGDEAAEALGYVPLGLKDYAGLVLAYHEAHERLFC